MRRLFATVLLLVPLAAGAVQVAAVDTAAVDTAAVDSATGQARALFERDWQWRLEHQPEYATTVGEHRYDGALSDTTLAASRAAIAHQRRMLERARVIARAALSSQDQLSLDLFVDDTERKLVKAAFYPYDPQPISAYDGLHVRLPQLVATMPFANETDYRNYLSRIDALPRHVDGLIEQMREGMKSGWVAPKSAMQALPGMLQQMRERLVDGPLGAPFRQIPATISQPVRDELAAAGPAALLASAAPALQNLENFVRNDYLPAARDTIGAASLPGGPAWYSYLVGNATTTDMSAAQIHALGLQEVARIRAEIDAAIARTGFRGSFAQFIVFARSDPRLFPRDAQALLARYGRVIARARAQLPLLFAAPALDDIGLKETGGNVPIAAYYEAGRPGRSAALVVNTTRLDTRPLWQIETLALHEALPGHHLQTARARQLSDLPAFRRFGWYVAYGEGWATYAESLGPEMGFYKDAFSHFGHLNEELFRAARLVVDTGIHAHGWSRQQAIDYLNANTANAARDNEIEVDRYIAWPAQALGYKIGQLKIAALRLRAEAALGPRFDLRRFHSEILDNGPLPLTLLEQQVDRWVAAQLRAAETAPAQ